MKNDEPMRNINPFGLRLQPDLKAKLEEAAKQNKRSLNAEISARLESTFPSPGTSLVPPKIAEQLAQTDSAALAALREKVWQVIDEAIAEALLPKKDDHRPVEARTGKEAKPNTRTLAVAGPCGKPMTLEVRKKKAYSTKPKAESKDE